MKIRKSIWSGSAAVILVGVVALIYSIAGRSGESGSVARAKPAVHNSELPDGPNESPNTPDATGKDYMKLDDIARRYPGIGIDTKVDADAAAEVSNAVGRATERCMALKGFEYHHDPTVVVTSDAASSRETRTDSKSPAERNAEIVGSLSREDARNYYLTLYGVEAPDEGTAPAPDAPQGCVTDASDSVTKRCFTDERG